MSDRLSLLLRAHVDDLKRELSEGQTPDERRQQLLGDIFVDALIASLIETRENFNPSERDPFELLSSDPETLEDLLDERYTLASLENVPDYVARTLKLSQLKSKDTPSRQTNAYVKEATRSYIFGFAMASVAMSRAALEQALEERLGRQGDATFVAFADLVEDAKKWKILGQTGARAAKEVARKCNAVLHEKPTNDEEESFRVLIETRSILEEIYSADGGY